MQRTSTPGTENGSTIRLLSIEPSIGAHLREDDRSEAAARLVVPSLWIPAGDWPHADQWRSEPFAPFGFLIHEGLLGRDPLALRGDDMRGAVRRRDAAGVWVRLDAQ